MSSLFSKPKAPPAPAPEPVMPLPDDDAIKMQKKKSFAALRKRSGRMSTILSQNEPLGE